MFFACLSTLGSSCRLGFICKELGGTCVFVSAEVFYAFSLPRLPYMMVVAVVVASSPSEGGFREKFLLVLIIVVLGCCSVDARRRHEVDDVHTHIVHWISCVVAPKFACCFCRRAVVGWASIRCFGVLSRLYSNARRMHVRRSASVSPFVLTGAGRACCEAT